MNINEIKQQAYAVHNGPWLSPPDIAALFAELERLERLNKSLRKENESLVEKIVDTEH